MLADLEHVRSSIPEWLSRALSVPRVQASVLVDDCPINYFTWGDDHNPALVFLHGRMSHARCWTFIAPLLADHFHCIAIDLSGMGDSGYRDVYLYETRAREVLAVIADTVEPTLPAVLVTHSYGCVVALNVLHAAPGQFTGLVACDPSLTHPEQWSEQTPRIDGPELSRPHRVSDSLDTLKARFAFAPEQPCKHDVLKEYIATHSIKAVEGGWQWKFDPWVYSTKEEGHNDWWVSHTQDFIAAPLKKAIIYGEESAMLDRATVNAVAERDQNIVYTKGIAGAHHHLMADEPQLLVSSLHRVVNKLLS